MVKPVAHGGRFAKRNVRQLRLDVGGNPGTGLADDSKTLTLDDSQVSQGDGRSLVGMLFPQLVQKCSSLCLLSINKGKRIFPHTIHLMRAALEMFLLVT